MFADFRPVRLDAWKHPPEVYDTLVEVGIRELRGSSQPTQRGFQSGPKVAFRAVVFSLAIIPLEWRSQQDCWHVSTAQVLCTLTLWNVRAETRVQLSLRTSKCKVPSDFLLSMRQPLKEVWF